MVDVVPTVVVVVGEVVVVVEVVAAVVAEVEAAVVAVAGMTRVVVIGHDHHQDYVDEKLVYGMHNFRGGIQRNEKNEMLEIVL